MPRKEYTRAELQSIVIRAARKYGIDERIALKQIETESAWNNYAGSGAGAKGLFQFIDGTARRFGLRDVYNPYEASEAYGKYMSFLLRKFNGRYDLALAGYNWGEGDRKKGNRSSLYKALDSGRSLLGFAIPLETRNYIRKILGGGDSSTVVENNAQNIEYSENGQFSSVFGVPFSGTITPMKAETKKAILLAIAAIIILYAVVNIYL